MSKLLQNAPDLPALRSSARDESTPSYAHLNSSQLKAELEGRTRSIQSTVEGLKADLSAVTGLSIGGHVIPQQVRQTALRNAAIAVAGGLVLGALMGLRARSKRKPEPQDAVDVLKVRLATLLDDAAARVARGTSSEEALRATLRDTPIVYNPPTTTASVEKQAKSSLRQAVDVGVKSLGGLALKFAMDELQQAFTGKKKNAAS